MSFTQSRGLHTIERWQTPAVLILAGLKAKQPERIPLGAFGALERFFSWVIEGIEWETDGKIPSNPGNARTNCTLAIALHAFGYTNPVDLKRPMEADLKIVRRMQARARYVGTVQNREVFRRHLSALAGPEDPDFQERSNTARKRWREKLQPLVDAARDSARITEKDLQIIVNV